MKLFHLLCIFGILGQVLCSTEDIECKMDLSVCRSGKAASHIIGGTEADPHEFPWFVLIKTFFKFNGNHLSQTCGGSLISKDLVATAAHCLYIPGTDEYSGCGGAYVVAGLHNRCCCGEQEQYSYVKEAFVHSSFIGTSKDGAYDIALLRLETAMEETDFVKIVKISNDQLNITDETIIVAAGFGRTENSSTGSKMLMKVDLDIVDVNECGKDFNSDVQLCAYKESKDTCVGDSGGPLMLKNENGTFLHGIVSKGLDDTCGTKAGIYTKISAFESWIGESHEFKKCNSTGLRESWINLILAVILIFSYGWY